MTVDRPLYAGNSATIAVSSHNHFTRLAFRFVPSPIYADITRFNRYRYKSKRVEIARTWEEYRLIK